MNPKNPYDEERIKVPKFEEDAGFYTTPQRSRIMGKIKGRNTKPEVRFRKILYATGVRYRVNNASLPGKPDLSNSSKKIAVFIDGEFWHGYDWANKKKQIKSNRGFWIPKIERNMQRDREVNYELQKMGFKVFRFWASEVKQNPGKCVQEILEHLSNP